MNNTKRDLNWMASGWRSLGMVMLSVMVVIFTAIPASANDRQGALQLVEKAQMTLQSFMSDSNMGTFRDLAKKANGVLVVPQQLKGGFIFGASWGSGVLMVRDGNTNRWFGPAFYTIGGGSFGFQAGAQASEVVLLIMTDRGVSSLMGNSLKLGADVGLAAGPIGAGAEASTANLSADILSFSRSKGLYGGISLDGAVVATRGGLNEAYYGKELTPAKILMSREVTNPQARGLISEVTKAACSPHAAGKC
jgi:SH3 domain-containing YSC84-like protein 1